MRQIHDDLIEMALEHQFDVIAHGCNNYAYYASMKKVEKPNIVNECYFEQR